MKRQRGRNRKPAGNNANPNRAYESNGPEGVKVRGNAQTIYEKYQQLARDANASGDRVLAENHLQHAEHYFRLIRAMQPQRPVSDFVQRDPFSNGFDFDEDDGDNDTGNEAETESDGAEPSERPDRHERSERNDRYDRNERRDRNDRRDRDRNRDDRNRDDRNRDDRPRDDRPRDDRPRDDRPRDDRPRDDRPRDDRPREERPRDENGDRRESRRDRYERRRNQRYTSDGFSADTSQEAGPVEAPTYDPLAVIAPSSAPLTDSHPAEAPVFVQELRPEARTEVPSSDPAPRGRGRPRRVDNAPVREDISADASQLPAFLQASVLPAGGDVSNGSVPDVPVKRGRGRPRRVPLGEDS
ncbi:MAG: DUF4167 domain-containing protein [Asticcacaulis sp.]